MNEVTLPRAIVNRILAHAQQADNAEVCGLVSAKAGIPLRVYPVPNAAGDSAVRYAMEPRAQIDAMRTMREAGEELFAIYHSHPHAPAAPSPIDVAEAAYPEVLQLIVSLNTQGVLELRGFRIRHGNVVPVVLLLA